MNNWVIVKSVFFLHAGYSLRALNNKFKMLVLVVKNWSELKLFCGRMSSALGKSGVEKLGGDCVGVVHWPYISRNWGPKNKLGVLASHYEVVTQRCPQLLLLGRNESLLLSDLSEFADGCSLVLDRPFWFMREGELVLNLFQGDLRIASIAFTLCRTDTELCIFIGAVQGIHKGVDSELSLSIYRDLTKDFEGLRPRSFLIEVIKYIAINIGVEKIYAVGDGYRHHRHPYFGAHKALELAANYDVIWLEHGATPSEREDFFEIPMVLSRKPLDSIASKKRAMYRRRYELLDDTFKKIDSVLIGSYCSNREAG
ncbi:MULTISPECIES: DUF535 family protein [unclassified Pseudomonas]|uniref:DUF535 family protein n=1 Tax=unclassified Pseudomonas TaxID=196821 RepID=UPI000C87BF92|nr:MULTISPECIES: DUF535 family protein [unclassified Pseudomonas]PMU12568.1 DUF535 domain-containing protein [Pseudomonas sp. FW305-20]PMU22302.1 DUF535 domain-containing protein [Pseudomonas sp. FW305-122]PMU43506.1 DUF535 domain-containing protein [Pseudomonas sp. FW305-47B]PMX64844.1 DUF535 domain-containing protein [Pseudomonas sp. FW305-33]PMX71109.1 DUF535 domain-containing protein [Pseudomonas sp. FW305-60]